MYRKYYIALSEVIIILTATVLFACMLVPAAGTAREKWNEAACIGNLKKLNEVWQNYAHDSNQWIARCGSDSPQDPGWYQTMAAMNYIPSRNARGELPVEITCGLAPGHSQYWLGTNRYLNKWTQLHAVKKPAASVFHADSAWYEYNAQWGSSFTSRHNGCQSNFSFADGHIETYRTSEDGLHSYAPEMLVYQIWQDKTGWKADGKRVDGRNQYKNISQF